MALAALRIAVCGVLLGGAAVVAAEPAKKPNEQPVAKFVRLVRDEKGSPETLETPIVRYAASSGDAASATVDLIAAIHIGEKSYYERLNREFEGYDAVLYELVAPEEASVPRRSDSGGKHPVSLLQNGMKDLLELEFQLQGIDYTRKNMVHADMSPDQFAESMKKQGDGMTAILARMLGYALTKQSEAGGAGDGQLLLALFDKNRSLALKRILAEQFENSEGMAAAIDGPDGSALIAGRNRVALDVLRREIDAGKKKIAIFYGGAHMSNFDAKLRDEFGMTPIGTTWLVAWKLKP